MMMMTEAFDILQDLIVSKLNESVKAAAANREDEDASSEGAINDIVDKATDNKSDHIAEFDGNRDAYTDKYTSEYNQAKKTLLNKVYNADAMDGLETVNMPLFVDAMLTAQGSVNDAISVHADAIAESIIKETGRRGWSAEYIAAEYGESGSQVIVKQALDAAKAAYTEDYGKAEDNKAEAEKVKSEREAAWTDKLADLNATAAAAVAAKDGWSASYAAGDLTNQEYYAEAGAKALAVDEANAAVSNGTAAHNASISLDDTTIDFWSDRMEVLTQEIENKTKELAAHGAAANTTNNELIASEEEATKVKSGLEAEIDVLKADKETAEDTAKDAVSAADDAYKAAKEAYDAANAADPDSPATSAALKTKGDKYLVLKTKEDDLSDVALPFTVEIIHLEARVKVLSSELDGLTEAKNAISAYVAEEEA